MHASHDQRFTSDGTSTVDGTPHWVAMLALITANVLLAFGPVFVRAADVGPVAAGFWRLALAMPFLAMAVAVANRRGAGQGGMPRLSPVLWGGVALGGLAFAADLGSWHLGILRTQLANATLFGNAAVLFFPIYGFFLARRLPSWSQALALVLALVGAMLLMGRSAELSARHLAGDALCLLGGLCYTVYFVTMAHVRTRLGPIPALTLTTATGMVPLLLTAIAMGERVMPHDWTPLIGLALASQVLGQGLMIFLLGRLTPMAIGIGLLIQPIIAGVIGSASYGERLEPVDLIGAGLVAVALVLVRRERRDALAGPGPDGA